MIERRLKLFRTAAAVCNFTEVAAMSGMTQPNVTKQIANLERRLGVQLFLFGGLRGVGEERGGREVGGNGGLRAFEDVSGDEAGERFPVDHAELDFEFGLCRGVGGVVMREQMRLSGGFDAFSEGFLHVEPPEDNRVFVRVCPGIIYILNPQQSNARAYFPERNLLNDVLIPRHQ